MRRMLAGLEVVPIKLIQLLTVAIVFTLVVASCNNQKLLTSDDLQWMPYKGDETLVFKSSKGEVDTIFLLRKNSLLSYPEPVKWNGITYEVVIVYCKHFDNRMMDSSHPYTDDAFLELRKAKDGRAELFPLLQAKGTYLYLNDAIKIDFLKGHKTISISTAAYPYIEVYKINADTEQLYGDRDGFVSTIYWSKSQGLIRFDKKGGVYWELVKKY